MFLTKSHFFLGLAVVSIAVVRTRTQETLYPEAGTLRATVLPLDRETSQIAYETATFGMG